MLHHYETIRSHFGENAGVRLARKHLAGYSTGCTAQLPSAPR